MKLSKNNAYVVEDLGFKARIYTCVNEMVIENGHSVSTRTYYVNVKHSQDQFQE